jgi:hypothetical protein
MSSDHPFRRSAALCLVLAASSLSLDDRFQTATVSEKLGFIRERVSAQGGERALQAAPLREAGNCYAGYWRNC